MNYKETIDFLFKSLPMYQRTGAAAYKANLNNSQALDRILGHPHNSFKCIHVAGTNGKGSISHMLASVLQASGYRTGLYTSPHLIDFRERIRINGAIINQDDVVDFVAKIKKPIDSLHPSFFEMTVAMAFEYYAKEKVDIAVIETGMGGRLDSTNIINPELSVITSISLDHTDFLGDTIESIAREKGGIIKPGIPVVSGQKDYSALGIIREIARERDSRTIDAFEQYHSRFKTKSLNSNSIFHFKKKNKNELIPVECDLNGDYQFENIAITLTAIDQLKTQGWEISEDTIKTGLKNVIKNTGLRGRWETLGANPMIICDTAHNEDGVRSVIRQLEQIPCKKMHIVWGMVKDKLPDKILSILPNTAHYYFCQASIPRSMPVEELVNAAKKHDLHSKSFNNVEKAFRSALKNADPSDLIFIGGSNFIVADLLQYLDT